MTTRAQSLDLVRSHSEPFDVIIIGGGATGSGVALDAASRGYSVLLLEQADFAKGTSSRSTKLVHGGVRYLAQGNISLVMEALHERDTLLKNAPHLVHPLEFLVPAYRWWEAPYYGIGLTMYALLAGRRSFGATTVMGATKTLARIPTLKTESLYGSVRYFDGQFDDARLVINLLQSASEQGAVTLNYAPVRGLTVEQGKVTGVTWEDLETGQVTTSKARIVINATGAYVDDVRRMGLAQSKNIIRPSQGSHVVVDGRFLPNGTGLMVPKTPDGRVLFAIPWHGHTVVGTTDVPIKDAPLEPTPTESEIDFILETAAPYFEKPFDRRDVLSTFAGVRPLVDTGATSTAALSREHYLALEQPGLLTITGGKWTTYRKMAEDTVDMAMKAAELPVKPCITATMPVYGADGGEGSAIKALERENAAWSAVLDPVFPNLTEAGVVYAARREFARTVEDFLARRTRTLFLDAAAAVRMAPRVAALLAAELGHGPEWVAGQVAGFGEVGSGYQLRG